jgi:hypothetical protein
MSILPSKRIRWLGRRHSSGSGSGTFLDPLDGRSFSGSLASRRSSADSWSTSATGSCDLRRPSRGPPAPRCRPAGPRMDCPAGSPGPRPASYREPDRSSTTEHTEYTEREGMPSLPCLLPCVPCVPWSRTVRREAGNRAARGWPISASSAARCRPRLRRSGWSRARASRRRRLPPSGVALDRDDPRVRVVADGESPERLLEVEGTSGRADSLRESARGLHRAHDLELLVVVLADDHDRPAGVTAGLQADLDRSPGIERGPAEFDPLPERLE